MPPKAKFSNFDRAFDPEYLVARKDISLVMLQTAEGKFQQVVDYITMPGEHHDMEIPVTNRDGNTLLLLAVANQHVELTKFLLEMKSDVNHRNQMNMDAIDYATMDGVRTPIARAVLSYVDYVIPEVCEGPYWSKGLHAIAELKETLVLAKMSLIGRTPDLVNHNPRDAEYATDWLKRLHYMVATVRKGVLLLSSEVGYLERDANLSGCLEVPADHRFVYLQEEGKVIKYMKAMLRPTVYGDAIGNRIMDACLAGDSGAVKGLLKARAPPDVEDMQGQSALMRAAQKGDRTIVRSLLVNKARIDTQSKDGFTALLLAAIGNNVEVVRKLLRAKANPHAKSCKGFTVLSFVKHEGHKDILNIFAEERGQAKQRAVSATPAFAPPERRSWNPLKW
mmetsp:Transcript_94209/g.270096  ORF Transcript_94209/g.270096 Transcript_94209/m.270096 type:complete len:393 (-) Transcript_94209:72-1250(-)